MTEKRYIVNTDCLCNEVLDTKFGSNGVDKPTEQEIEDKDFFILCDVFPKSVADKLCKRLNRYENENKELKEQLSGFDFLKDENRHMITVLEENNELKKLLRKISNCNGEIWLDNGQIVRLKKVFKGEWVND